MSCRIMLATVRSSSGLGMEKFFCAMARTLLVCPVPKSFLSMYGLASANSFS